MKIFKSRGVVKTMFQILVLGGGIVLLVMAIIDLIPHTVSEAQSGGYPPPEETFSPYPDPNLITQLATVTPPPLRDLKDGHVLSQAEIGAMATEIFWSSHMPTRDSRTPIPTKATFPVGSVTDLPEVVYHDPFYGSSETGMGDCIQSKNPGQPQLIHSLDGFPDYYLVPFFKDKHLCATALVNVMGDSGMVTALGGASGDQFPQVSADEAVNLVVAKTGKQIAGNPVLVTVEAMETAGPLDPSWQLTTIDNEVYYVIFITGPAEGSDTPKTDITILSTSEIHRIK